MSLTYTTWVQRMVELASLGEQTVNFASVIPAVIDYAEQRLYRELDLLSTQVRDTSSNCTANSRNFTLPSSGGRFVVVDGINVVTPVAGTVSTGTRHPVVPASRDFLDLAWPSNTAVSATTIPQFFAMITDQTIAFGPPPGDTFQVEVIGEIRPTPLSAANATTYLSLYLPDLFLAASMIHMATYGTQGGANSPQVATWEQTYQTLFPSANTEAQRQRFAGASWTSKPVQPAAVPQRG